MVTNIFNKLSKNSPTDHFFKQIIMVLRAIKVGGSKLKQSFVYLSFVFLVQNFFS